MVVHYLKLYGIVGKGLLLLKQFAIEQNDIAWASSHRVESAESRIFESKRKNGGAHKKVGELECRYPNA